MNLAAQPNAAQPNKEDHTDVGLSRRRGGGVPPLRQLQPVRRWLRAGSLRLRSAGARLPVRWRLALTSFGLLAVLLAALGLLLSFSEERALLMNEATALHNAADLTT